MKHSTRLFKDLLSPYALRIFGVVLMNIPTVVASILSLLMIDPLVSILFPSAKSVSPFAVLLDKIFPNFFQHVPALNSLVALIVLFLLLYMLKILCQFLTAWIYAPVKTGVVKDLRQRIYEKVLILPLSFFFRAAKR